MLILGIDPGSINTGWGLIHKQGKKISYVSSGVLNFSEKDFMQRLPEIKSQIKKLISELKPDAISMESLIYVKSPTALIKLAQTRGIILSVLIDKYQGKIFEYSPNFIKSQTVGHGHANKESVQKFLQMMFGDIKFKTHDESDALAIAICHALENSRFPRVKNTKAKSGSLKSSLAHRIKQP